ncbi:MAG: methyltransferase domain-containing protein [Acidobacteriota bacterium]
MTLTTTSTRDAARPAVTRAAQIFWSRYFGVYDTLNQARPYQAMIARQVELLAPRPGDRVLDAGTGSGNLAAALVRTGADVVGIDFCEPAFELARRKAPTATFRFGDLTRPLAFANGEFDLVACSAVLHVLSGREQRAAMGELARVLRPGGRLVVTAFATGFSAVAVYLDTLRAERRARGLAATAVFGLRYSWNTARVLYYVWRIQRQQRRGAYAYVNEAGLASLLSESGLDPRTLDRTLAGQCVTALAVKPVSAA